MSGFQIKSLRCTVAFLNNIFVNNHISSFFQSPWILTRIHKMLNEKIVLYGMYMFWKQTNICWTFIHIIFLSKHIRVFIHIVLLIPIYLDIH